MPKALISMQESDKTREKGGMNKEIVKIAGDLEEREKWCKGLWNRQKDREGMKRWKMEDKERRERV